MTARAMPQYRYRGSVPPPETREPVRAQVTPMAAANAAGGTVATIRIDDVIDSWGGVWGIASREVSTVLDQLPDTVKSIQLEINSPGGEASEGVAIMNAFRSHPATVDVTVTGIAASAASLVAMAGDTRKVALGAQLMVHDAWVLAIGNADDLRAIADVVDKISSSYASVYAAVAGGSKDEWRGVMRAETWFTAQEALDAGLATAIDAKEADPKATSRFDLSVFAHAGRAQAPAPHIPATQATQTPAEQPVTPSTDHKEADAMSDTLLDGLRKQLGLPDDADEATVLAANAEALNEKADPPATLDASAIKAALEADGKTVVSKNVLDELTAQAQAGAQARAKQLEEERDATIAKAFSDGKISAERREAWKASWDKDPEGTKADLDSLPARFPVGQAKGHQGDGDTANAEVITDEQATAVAAQFGIPKEALLNG